MNDLARQIRALYCQPMANGDQLAHLLLQMLDRIEALETKVLEAEIAASKGAQQ